MTKKNKSWGENWKFIKTIGSGGQGQTSLVQPRNNSYPPGQYVLKELHRQKDHERRGRMRREVIALTTLEHPGIPKIIDNNSEYFTDLDTPLYLVREFVPGATLFKFITKKTMNIPDAVMFILKLLDILEYCHKAETFHRDIKPDNIMIKNNDIQNPVLIDFGLSFNKDDHDATNLTPTGQQLGNRFLHLPELLEKSSQPRDSRSDITQCCGILFFVITGKNPTTLLDSEGKKPHQRPSLNQKLLVLEESILTKINRIFDRGFEIKIDSRWQSIPALEDALIDLPEPSHNKSEDYLTRIKNKLSGSSKYEECKLFQDLAQQIIEEIYDIVQDIVIELGSDFNLIHDHLSLWSCPKVRINWDVLTFSQKVVCISYVFSKQLFNPKFRGYITGNEVILVSDLKGKEVELLRTPLSGEPDFTGFSKRLTEFYYEGIDSIM